MYMCFEEAQKADRAVAGNLRLARSEDISSFKTRAPETDDYPRGSKYPGPKSH